MQEIARADGRVRRMRARHARELLNLFVCLLRRFEFLLGVGRLPSPQEENRERPDKLCSTPVRNSSDGESHRQITPQTLSLSPCIRVNTGQSFSSRTKTRKIFSRIRSLFRDEESRLPRKQQPARGRELEPA